MSDTTTTNNVGSNDVQNFGQILQTLFSESFGAAPKPQESTERKTQTDDTDQESTDSDRSNEDDLLREEWQAMLKLLESHEHVCSTFALLLRNKYDS